MSAAVDATQACATIGAFMRCSKMKRIQRQMSNLLSVFLSSFDLVHVGAETV
jgi:hypothetical protein